MTTSNDRNWLYAYLLFALVMLVLTFPLLRQTVAPIWDANDLIYPAFSYLGESLREGRLPLWDPFTNSGDPFHSDPNRLTLSPLAQAFSLLFDKASLGFVAFWLFHWWWGGTGILWLARQFGATPTGSLVAAFSYAFSGFFIGHAEHTNFIIFASWLPWIIGLADKAVEKKDLTFALLSGAAFGFCSLDGGYPGFIAMTGIVIGFWLIFRHLIPHSKNEPLMSRMMWIIYTLSIIGIILFVAWAPYIKAFFIEGAGFTDRVLSVKAQDAIYQSPFTPKALVSLFFPFSTILFSSFTNIFDGNDWLGADLSMTNAYTGILTIPLAVTWLREKNALRKRFWLILFVGSMFLISLGGYGGIRTLLYYLVPPTRFMRYNGAFRIYWILPLCLAAGLGFSLIARDLESRRNFFRLLLPWLALTIIIGGLIGWFPTSRGFYFSEYAPRLFMPAVIVLPLMVITLWFWSYFPQTFANRVMVFLLTGLIICDMGGHLFTNEFTVWSEDNAKSIRFLEDKLSRKTITIAGEPGPRLSTSPTGSANSQQITKIPIVSGYMPYQSVEFNEILVKSRFIEILTAPYRFWLSPGAEVNSSHQKVLDSLTTVGRSSFVPVFVESQLSLPPLRVVPGAFGGVSVTSYAPEEVVVQVQVPGENNALLTSTERFAAGWKVWVDGKVQPALRTNLYFRGVLVPPGVHTVTWRYEPYLWKPLVIASYATITLAVVIAMIFRRKDSQAR